MLSFFYQIILFVNLSESTDFVVVLYGTGEEVSVQHHQRYHPNRPSVYHGSVGVLAAARVRRESFARNHGSFVFLCVSVGCG